MTPKELEIKLRAEFDLVVFQDLARCWNLHQAAFDLFESVKAASFEPRQRLILYSSQNLTQEFLNHIQRAAADVDISNFFILIACPFDITNKLQQANQLHGYDDSVIQSLQVPLTGTEPFGTGGFYSMDSLCPMPFSSATINATGGVRPCCKFPDAVGDIRQQTVLEIFHGDAMRSLRHSMLSGQRPDQCAVCWHNESTGTTSLRQLMLNKYGNLIDRQWLDNVHLRDVTWMPMTLCNFTCRICSSVSSTAWAVEDMKFAPDPAAINLSQLRIKTSNDDKLSDTMIESLGSATELTNLHILGGEPFLWPRLDSMLDTLIVDGQSHRVILEFNTNGSVFPEQQLEKIITHFRGLEILISIDNVGKRFEIERGGRWIEVATNLQRFTELQSPQVQIKLAVTVNLQNVLYLDEILTLAKNLDLGIVWWYLEQPAALGIDFATHATKQLVFDRYHDHSESELRKIASRMQNSPGSDGSEFLSYCRQLDQRRNQNFSHSHPEIFESMGGCYTY